MCAYHLLCATSFHYLKSSKRINMIQSKSSLWKNVWEIVNAYPGVQSKDMVKYYKEYYGETLDIDVLSMALSNLFRIKKVTRVGKKNALKYSSCVPSYMGTPPTPTAVNIIAASSAPVPLSKVIADLPSLGLNKDQVELKTTKQPQPSYTKIRNKGIVKKLFNLLKDSPNSTPADIVDLYFKKYSVAIDGATVSTVLSYIFRHGKANRVGTHGSLRYTAGVGKHGANYKSSSEVPCVTIKESQPVTDVKVESRAPVDLDKLLDSLSTVEVISLYKKLKILFSDIQ